MLPQDQDIAALTDKLLTMGSLAIASSRTALRALTDRDDEQALQVEKDDNAIDELEKEVDELCITLLSRAPLATDLRRITVAMKINADLERVGDEATAIARRARELNKEPQLKPYMDIPRMAGMALDMLKGALDAYVDRLADQAREIIPRDKEVDAINKQLQRELASFMIENPANITRCLYLIEISKRIERIADHAANIAEQTVYLLDGEDIRHTINKKTMPTA